MPAVPPSDVTDCRYRPAGHQAANAGVVPRHASARSRQERVVQHRVGPATWGLDQCRLAGSAQTDPGDDRAAARHPAFRWANTVLANVKNSLLATHRAVAAKHLPRYLGAFAWRFNRRFVLKTIHERLAIAAAATPPMPYRLLKLAEARW